MDASDFFAIYDRGLLMRHAPTIATVASNAPMTITVLEESFVLALNDETVTAVGEPVPLSDMVHGEN